MATILLIHGAYLGGWSWIHVAARLRAQGHHVLAPTLEGCAERAHALRAGITPETHAAELAGLLFHEDLRDVVAVGTSTGGMVMARLAEIARDRLRRLVFADALALQHGEKLSDFLQRPKAITTDLSTVPSREDAEGRLFAEMDPALRAWTIARMTPHPVAAMEGPVVLPDFWRSSWPRTAVIVCTRSTNPPLTHQRRIRDAFDASWSEIDTGHYPFLTTPDELARLIMAPGASG